MTHPDLAAQWDVQRNGSLTPSMVSAGKCQADSSCPSLHSVPAKRTVASPYTWLFCVHAQLESVLDPASTRRTRRLHDWRAGSGVFPWWLCDGCGHSWQAQAHKRSDGQACPKCAQTRRDRKLRAFLLCLTACCICSDP